MPHRRCLTAALPGMPRSTTSPQRGCSMSAAADWSPRAIGFASVLDVLTGDDDVEALRSRLADLQAGMPADDGLWDAAAGGPPNPPRARRTRRRHDRASAGRRGLRDAPQGRRGGGETAGREGMTGGPRQGEAARRAGRAGASRRSASPQQRATVGDDEHRRQGRGRRREGAPRHRARSPDSAANSPAAHPTPSPPPWTRQRRRRRRVGCRHDEAAEALRVVTAQLKVYGTEGRKCQLDAAETEREHAEAEYRRVHGSGPGRPAAPLRDGTAP